MEYNYKSRNKPIHLWSTDFNKDIKTIQMKKEPFQQIVLGLFTCKRMKFYLFLTPHTKINFKWITRLNVRAKAIKPTEEKQQK